MNKHPVITLLFVLLALISAPLHADPGKDKSPLELAADQWIAHFTSGDLDALMTLYTDDATVALHGQPMLQGKAAVRAYFADRIGNMDSHFELEFERIEMGETTSWLISKYWFVAEFPTTGERFLDAGRSMLIYQRSESGQWLIAADIDQSTPDVDWPSPSGVN